MADLAAVMALYSESGLDVPDLAAQVAALRREVLALKDAVQGMRDVKSDVEKTSQHAGKVSSSSAGAGPMWDVGDTPPSL